MAEEYLVNLDVHDNAPKGWTDFIGSSSVPIKIYANDLKPGHTDEDVLKAANDIYMENLRDWERATASKSMEQIANAEVKEQRSLDPRMFRQQVYESVYGQGAPDKDSPLRDDSSWLDHVTRYKESAFREGDRVESIIGQSMQKKNDAFKNLEAAQDLQVNVGLENMKKLGRERIAKKGEEDRRKMLQEAWGHYNLPRMKTPKSLLRARGSAEGESVTYTYLNPETNTFEKRTAEGGQALTVWDNEDQAFKVEFVELEDIPRRAYETEMRQRMGRAKTEIPFLREGGKLQTIAEAVTRFSKDAADITAEDVAFVLDNEVSASDLMSYPGVYIPPWAREALMFGYKETDRINKEADERSKQKQKNVVEAVRRLANLEIDGDPILRMFQSVGAELAGDYTTKQVDMLQGLVDFLPLSQQSSEEVGTILEEYGNRGLASARNKAADLISKQRGITKEKVKMADIEQVRKDLRNMPTEEWTTKYPELAAPYGAQADSLPSGAIAAFGRDAFAGIIGEEGVEGLFADARTQRKMERFAEDVDPFDAWEAANKIYTDTIVKRARENSFLSNAVEGVGDMWVGLFQMGYQPLEEILLIPSGLVSDDDDETYRFLRSLYVDRLESEEGQLRGLLGGEEQALKGISKKRSLAEFGAGFLQQYEKLFTDFPTMFEGDPVGTVATALDIFRLGAGTASRMAALGGPAAPKFASIAERLNAIVQKGDSFIKNAMFAGMPFAHNMFIKYGSRSAQNLLQKPAQIIQDLQNSDDISGSMRTSASSFQTIYDEAYSTDSSRYPELEGLTPSLRNLQAHRITYEKAISGIPAEDAGLIAKAALIDVAGQISGKLGSYLRKVDPNAAEGHLNTLLNGDMAKLVDDLELSEAQMDALHKDLTESGIPEIYRPVSYFDIPTPVKTKKQKPEPPREKGLPPYIRAIGVDPMPSGVSLGNVIITGADGKPRRESLGPLETKLASPELLRPVLERALREDDPANPITKPITRNGITKTALEWEMERIEARIGQGKTVPPPVIYLDEMTGSAIIPSKYPLRVSRLRKFFPGMSFTKNNVTNTATLAVLLNTIPEAARKNPEITLQGRSIPVAVPASQVPMMRGEAGARISAVAGMLDPKTGRTMSPRQTYNRINLLKKERETAAQRYAKARRLELAFKREGITTKKAQNASARVNKHNERVIELDRQIRELEQTIDVVESQTKSGKKRIKVDWKKLPGDKQVDVSEPFREVVTRSDIEARLADAYAQLDAFMDEFVKPQEEKEFAHSKKYTRERITGKGKLVDEALERASLSGSKAEIRREFLKMRRQLGIDRLEDAKKTLDRSGAGLGRQDFVSALLTEDPRISRSGKQYPESAAKLRGAVGEAGRSSPLLRRLGGEIEAEFVLAEGTELVPRGGYWDLQPEYVETPRPGDYGPQVQVLKKLDAPYHDISGAKGPTKPTPTSKFGKKIAAIEEAAGRYFETTYNPDDMSMSRVEKFRDGAAITPEQMKTRLDDAMKDYEQAQRKKYAKRYEEEMQAYRDARALQKRMQQKLTDADIDKALDIGQRNLELARERQGLELQRITAEGIARGADWVEGRASIENATEMPWIVPGRLEDVQARSAMLTPEQQKAAQDMGYQAMPENVAERIGLDVDGEYVVSAPFIRGVEQLISLDRVMSKSGPVGIAMDLLRSLGSQWKRSKTLRSSAFIVNLMSSYMLRGLADNRWSPDGLIETRKLLQDYADRKITDPETVRLMADFDSLGLLAGVDKDVRIQTGRPGERVQARVFTELIESWISGIDPTTMTKKQIEERLADLNPADMRRALRLWNEGFSRLEKAYVGTDPVFKVEAALNAINNIRSSLDNLQVGKELTIPVDELRYITIKKNGPNDFATNTGMDVRDAVNRYGALSANRKYFDYRTLPYVHQMSRATGIEAVLYPFYAFVYNSRYIPLVKRGLMREILTGSADFTTNDPLLRGSQSKTTAANIFKREIVRRSSSIIGQESGIVGDLIDFAMRWAANKENQDILSIVGPDEMNVLGFSGVHVNTSDMPLFRGVGNLIKQTQSPMMVIPANEMLNAKVGKKTFLKYVDSGAGKKRSDVAYRTPERAKDSRRIVRNKRGAVDFVKAAMGGDAQKMAELEELFRKVDDSAPGKSSLIENLVYTVAKVATGIEDPRGFNMVEYAQAMLDVAGSMVTDRDVGENVKSLALALETVTSSSSIAQSLARAIATEDLKGLVAGLRSKNVDIKKLQSSIQEKLKEWTTTAKLDAGVGKAAIDRSIAKQKKTAKDAGMQNMGARSMRQRLQQSKTRLEQSYSEELEGRVKREQSAVDALSELEQKLIKAQLVDAAVRMQRDAANIKFDVQLRKEGLLPSELRDTRYKAPDSIGVAPILAPRRVPYNLGAGL